MVESSGHSYHLIFLDCSDTVLIKRFSETRRLHPLVKGQTKSESIAENITAERRLLAEAREMANVVIDTTDLRPMDLRGRINEIYLGSPRTIRSWWTFFPSATSMVRRLMP